MPTYEYECDGCGHKFEEFQSMSEDALTKCPECKKKKLRRLFGTGAAVIFKGSGFYQTDYRSDSYKQAAQKDSEAANSSGDSKSGDGKSGKTDSASSSDKSGGGKSSESQKSSKSKD